MATVNPYAGNVIHFPPGTPPGVINAYYSAYVRNQAQSSKYDPWQETLDAFQKQVLNPYLKTWSQMPFEDYRKTYDVNELIRAKQAETDALVAAKKQEAIDAFAQSQEVQKALGNAYLGLGNQMQPTEPPILDQYPAVPLPPTAPPMPDTGYPTTSQPSADQVGSGDTGSWQQYYTDTSAPSPDIQPSAPSEPDLSGASWQQAYTDTTAPYAGPPPLPDPNQYPPAQYTDLYARDAATGQIAGLSNGTQWYVPPERPPGPGAPMLEGSAVPTATPAAVTAPAAGPPAAPTPVKPVPFVPMTPPNLQSPKEMVRHVPTLQEALLTQAGLDPTGAGTIIQGLEKNTQLANLLDQARRDALAATTLKTLAQAGQAQAGAGLTQAKTSTEDLLRDPRVQALLAATGLTKTRTELTGQQAVDAQLKQQRLTEAMDAYDQGLISKEELMTRVAAATGKSQTATDRPTDTKTFSTELNNQRADPANAGKSENELRVLAQVALDKRPIERAIQTAQSTMPWQIAGRELPKLDDQQGTLRTFVDNIQTLEAAVQTLKSVGLPDTPSQISQWGTQLQRLNPKAWADPNVQAAYRVVQEFAPNVIGSYDRNVSGVIGMPRIREAYNFPRDPSLLSPSEYQGLFDAMYKGVRQADATIAMRRDKLQRGDTSGLGPTLPPTGGIPMPASSGRINVIRKSDGKPGTILESDFDPTTYERQ